MQTTVNRNDNQCNMRTFFKRGDYVIVIDGSYMTSPSREHVSGNMFKTEEGYILLKITEISTPHPTENSKMDSLVPINNCELTSHDGEKFYCSNLNIERFEFIA